MVDKKKFALIVVVLFIMLTIYLYMNNDSVASIIVQDGLKGLMWYILSNAAYVLIFLSIILFNRGVPFIKNIAGATLLVYAFDIVSYPRFSPSGMPMEVALLASSDGIIMNKLITIMPYSSAYTFYYLILPISMILLSLYLLGENTFIKKVMS